MDRFVAAFPAERDDDLMLCAEHGVAYQRDMSHRIQVPYFDIYNGYDGAEQRRIAAELTLGRMAFVDKHAGRAFPILDVGIGCGAFVKARPYTYGFDVEPRAVEWLKGWGWWSDDFASFRGFTFWDVIEHLEEPVSYFQHIGDGSYLFTCLPIFEDFAQLRKSKHYRPGEHLYYWSERGFVDWMGLHRFKLLERADFETAAGRDSVLSFAFRRESTQ